MRIALATCAAFPDGDPDDAHLAAALPEACFAVWDDPAEDWSAFDLVVIRSTWDYQERRDEFLAWVRSVPRIVNPPDVVEWNTDKRYLAELGAAGVPVVPTEYLDPADPPWTPSSTGEYVIKPTVGVGSLSAGRYDLGDPEQRAMAFRHASRFRATRRVAMVQPYLPGVDAYGETGLIFLDGRFSHAIRKGPMLTGPAAQAAGLYRPEEISARQPAPAELAVAEKVMSTIANETHLLYARVDLLPGQDGGPVLVELELTEPSLYLGYATGAADRLADAIVSRVGVPRV
jgi:hypothetical protein